jgi:hypothetical protein
MLYKCSMERGQSTPSHTQALPVTLDGPPPTPSRFNAPLSALLDRLLCIESELADVKQLLEEGLPGQARSAVALPASHLYIYWACRECCLPRAGFAHPQCPGAAQGREGVCGD